MKNENSECSSTEEVSGLEKTPFIAFILELYNRPNWRFLRSTGLYVYKEAVIVNFAELGGLYHGQSQPFLQNLTAFEDVSFSPDRQFAYLPAELNQSLKDLLVNSENAWGYYDDEQEGAI